MEVYGDSQVHIAGGLVGHFFLKFSILNLFSEGDMLDAMATGVETSKVILLCMTERYQDSQNCRTGNTS